MQDTEETTRFLNAFAEEHAQRFGTILLDPPWRFMNRTGKVAPEHRRLARYKTMSLQALERPGGAARPFPGGGRAERQAVARSSLGIVARIRPIGTPLVPDDG